MKIHSKVVEFFKERLYYTAEKVLEIYHSPFQVNYKSDKSPLTQADILASQILTEAIQTLFPEDFIISEEVKLSPNIKIPENFWLIDPIDGTKEFVNKTGDFTLNIGYVENGFPVWGMVYAPVYQELYYGGIEYGIHYEKNGRVQSIRSTPHHEVIALISRSHFTGKEDSILNQLGVTKKVQLGSSLKICKLALNEADIYLRIGETSEWDIAPAHAILAASKGLIVTRNAQHLVYGKPTLINPSFIAFSANYLNQFPKVIENLTHIFI